MALQFQYKKTSGDLLYSSVYVRNTIQLLIKNGKNGTFYVTWFLYTTI